MRLIIGCILLISINSFADQREDIANSFMKALKKELVQGMKKGVVNGLNHCYDKAMLVTKSFNEKEFSVGRVSLKTRNADNFPSKELRKILLEYSTSTAKNPMPPRVVKLTTKQEVYLKPLYVQGACLACHGTSISKELSKEITKKYPNDKATGYKLGDFRGLVWVKEK